MSTNQDAALAVEQSHVTQSLHPLRIWTSYRGSAGLELREDLRVDHVQLGLDLVAPGVVDRGHVFVQDQMFRRGWKPAKAKQTVPTPTILREREGGDRQTSPSSSCTDRCSERALGRCAPPALRRPRGLPSDIWRRPQMKNLAQSRSDKPGWKRHLLSCWSEHTASTNASDGHSTTMKMGPGSVGVHTCSGRI